MRPVANIDRIIRHIGLQWALAALLVLVTTLFLFPPDHFLARWIAPYATHWMFFCLVTGVIFMFLDVNRILYLAFGCAGLLALLLQYSFNPSIALAREEGDRSLSVLFVNPAQSRDRPAETLDKILAYAADVVILEDFSADWNVHSLRLADQYPYYQKMIREDTLGKAIFSTRRILSSIDPEFSGIPALLCRIRYNDSTELTLGTCSSRPPLSVDDYNRLNLFLDSLALYLPTQRGPKLMAIHLNIEPWSRELRTFKARTGLVSSRRESTEGMDEKSVLSIFASPGGEILFDGQVECSHFSVFTDSGRNPIGIFGRYQFRRG